MSLILLLGLMSSMVIAQNDSIGEGLYFKCPQVWFGKPNPKDCAVALEQFPDFQKGSITARARDRRMFVEPQFLEPPFRRLENPFQTSMEQLPKIYRYSKFVRELARSKEVKDQTLVGSRCCLLPIQGEKCIP